MPLKVELDSLDGVDENVQPLYKEHDDGRYRLDIEGMPDISGLKSALQKERETVTEFRSKLKSFEGVDLDEYRSLKERAEELEAADPKKIEELVESRVKDRLKKNSETYENKLNELNQKYEGANSRLEALLVQDALRKIGAEIGVADGEPMEDFVMRGRSLFKMHDGEVRPLNEKGEIIYGQDGVAPLTMKEWGEQLREKAIHLFKPSNGGGAANQSGGQGGARTVKSKSDLGKPGFPSRTAYIREHGESAYLALPKSRD